MNKRTIPTPEELRNLLRYEPDTGKLYWRERPRSMFADSKTRTASHICNNWNGRYAGVEAYTCISVGGYHEGCVMYFRSYAHRVIWAMVYGYWPEQVDHINHDRTDNRLINLRDVPPLGNSTNRGAHSSGDIMGVSICKRTNKWRARIGVNNKSIHLGRYDAVEDAVTARKTAEIKYGFHANHGHLASNT